MPQGPLCATFGAAIRRPARGLARPGTHPPHARRARGDSPLSAAIASAGAHSFRTPFLTLALLLLAPVFGGCSVKLRMAEIEDPSQATSTITYTGVRDKARRFPDYGSIDGSILDPTVGEAQ
jgi:hypothetical protein